MQFINPESFIDELSYKWIESYKLQFVNPSGHSKWAFPDVAIKDPYEIVRFQTSNVEGFIESFLSEKEKNDNLQDES